MTKKKIFKLLILCIVLFAVIGTGVLFARAGGAGGRSSSGGGEGIGEIIYFIIRILLDPYIPWPVKAVIIGVLIVIALAVTKAKRAESVLNKLPDGISVKKIRGYDAFCKNNPSFDEKEFKEKVRVAFIKIQKAWEVQNLSEVRRFISDGVYQRFNTQFKMMGMLDQQNIIEKLNVKNIYIDKVESDGRYDIVHAAIHASTHDKFVSDTFPNLNTRGSEDFVEYWSFIKKRGVGGKDLYHSSNCPNCGDRLPDKANDISKCSSCGTLVNSGEYDWVLAEITQADDYINVSKKLQKQREKNHTDKLRVLIKEDADFCVQHIEDKASNGYLQIITAQVFNKPELMRRFVTDDAFKKLAGPNNNSGMIYNRIYLNDVTLVGVREDSTKYYLAVSIKSSFQRVKIEHKKAHLVDGAVISKREIMIMCRDKARGENKGSLYAHNCPNCGGTLDDTLDTSCPYCGSELNSPKHEWIIEDIVSVTGYQEMLNGDRASFTYSVDALKLDKMYAVRDYAINNVMIMVAADGIFDKGEIEFTSNLAKKWGYDLSRIKPLFNMAQSGRLVIRMPEDFKQRKRIYKLMRQAAMADGTIDPVEQQLLDSVEAEFLK